MPWPNNSASPANYKLTWSFQSNFGTYRSGPKHSVQFDVHLFKPTVFHLPTFGGCGRKLIYLGPTRFEMLPESHSKLHN